MAAQRRLTRGAALWLAAWLGCACETLASSPDVEPSSATAQVALTPEQLRDPQTCQPCHAQHYREWQSSMHAYAAQDPVFIAMNERGQQETQGELGEFCVRCHAPLALELGLTRDGLNLPDLRDPSARGVTCYTCHNANAVRGDHNQQLVLGHDDVLHGGLGDGNAGRNAQPAIANRAHHSQYSALHDGTQLSSSSLCGSCHDVVNDHGVALERTFAEWRATRFAQAGPEQRSCGQCHMPSYLGRASTDGPERELHRHLFAGVDVALEKKFPGVAAQQAAIDCAFEGAIELTLSAASEPDAPLAVDVHVTNRAIGHSFPSGAGQDRRAWVELIAYDAQGAEIYQSGAVSDDAIVGAEGDPTPVLRDALYDATGKHVHMFWQAAPSAAHPLGYESDLLAAGETRTFRHDLPRPAARITARLRLRSIGLEVLDDFAGLRLPISERVIDNGYLDDGPIRSRIRTITVPGTERELRFVSGTTELSAAQPSNPECETQGYVSLLPP